MMKFKVHFLNKIKDLTDTDVKVMMGDSTVTEQKTFDPKTGIRLFSK